MRLNNYSLHKTQYSVEDFMTPLLKRPIEHLLATLEISTTRWIIGIAGLPGSGKSTLVQHLVDSINAHTAPNTSVALGMDGFHLTKAALKRMPDPEQAFARRGAPWTFDTDAFYTRLQMIRQAVRQDAVLWPTFEHAIGDPIEDGTIIQPTTRLILVEGLYLLHRADGWERISQSFDERWYLATPVETAMERLALRHMQAWGMTRSEAEQRIAGNDRLNAMLVAESAPFADWLVIPEATETDHD
jgi:pantothenate kinase